MIKVSVIGQDTLAKATFECCSRFFDTYQELHDDVDVVWVCYDTPIGDDDQPDVGWVLERISDVMDQIYQSNNKPLILVSSQLPVGSIAALEKTYPEHTFASQPENIRVKTAVQDFEDQSRMVVGIRTSKYDGVLSELLGVFTKNIIWTTPETAEMSKAALNTFLALQIAYINEIAKICKIVGADVDKVSEALKTDSRVSGRAPLRAGAPYGGGHLAREIYNLNQIASTADVSVPIIAHIKESNDE